MHTQPWINFQYDVGEERGQVRLKLPVNAVSFCEPFVVTAAQFSQLWGYAKYRKAMKYIILIIFIIIIYRFNLDLVRAGNLQTLKRILTYNEKRGHFVQGIDPAHPNIVGFSGNHLEGQMFVMMEISGTGTGCMMQVGTDVSQEFTQDVIGTLLEIMAAK